MQFTIALLLCGKCNNEKFMGFKLFISYTSDHQPFEEKNWLRDAITMDNEKIEYQKMSSTVYG